MVIGSIKRQLYQIASTLLVAGLFSCGASSEVDKEPQSQAFQLAGNWPNAVTYEIFVQSFYDTNGDGIGDLNGVTAKLDYLKDLGVEAMWLMPISPSPSYHKYDVTDYRDIHPDYGTKEDFKRLVEEAHNRNIKVVIDLVINHSSAEHPWFKEAVADPQSPYRSYYVWAQKDSIADQISKKEVHLDSDNITQWHSADSSDQLYYGFFWGGMPDLNYDHQPLKDEIFDIGRFWLEEMDVDGFRLDAAKHIFTDDRQIDNHQWWEQFKAEMMKIKPDVFLLGEVWSDAETVGPYLKGLPALFNFDVGRGIIEAVDQEQGGALLSQILEIQNYYRQINPQYIDAIFITNHDQNRIASELNGNKPKLKLAASLLMTLPGSPYIYYGEELGMLGIKPDEHIREPFNWDVDGSDDGETTWITPKHTTDQAVAPLTQQQADSSSIFNHYRSLIQIRNDQAALTYGNLVPQLAEEQLSSFLRTYEQDSLWVIHNLSGQEQQIQRQYINIDELLFQNGQISVDSQSISLPAYSSVILSN